MWSPRYWANRFWALRYWCKAGSAEVSRINYRVEAVQGYVSGAEAVQVEQNGAVELQAVVSGADVMQF